MLNNVLLQKKVFCLFSNLFELGLQKKEKRKWMNFKHILFHTGIVLKQFGEQLLIQLYKCVWQMLLHIFISLTRGYF